MGFKLKHAASVNRNIHLMSRLSLWTVNFRRLATKCLTLIRNDPRAESAASQTARNLQMQSRHAWTHCSLCLPRGLSWLLFIIHFFRVRCLNSNLERLLPGSITNVAHFSLPQIPVLRHFVLRHKVQDPVDPSAVQTVKLEEKGLLINHCKV